MRMPRLVRKFLKASWRKRILVLEAALWLSLARLALAVFPFEKIVRLQGELQAPAPLDTRPSTQEPEAVEVAWAVARAAGALPFVTVCLPRALAAAYMLHVRGLPSRLHFGVARRDASGQMRTHAWLDSGSVQVTGYPLTDEFIELGFYTR